MTRIEVHPGASIGRNLGINHGVGIVVGELAAIGDDCVLTQSVTLDEANTLGMPSLGDRVVVGANAVLLGAITIGDDAKISAGAIVLRDVPAVWTAGGNPACLLPPKAQRDETATDD